MTTRVHLRTLGCRLNQGEIDRMARQFAGAGYEIAPGPETAALVIVNTCAVTAEAVRSSRQTIHQMRRANPEAQIVVTGCYAHIAPEEISVLPGVAQVINNLAKDSLVSILTQKPMAEIEQYDHEPLLREPLVGAGGKTRAFLKVQDGCDRHCAFCVTRIARGQGRSRPLEAILKEAQALHASGYQEAVLTGVHLGSYGHDLGQTDGLSQLIRALLEDTDFPRIRLSSLEPWGISAGFFRLWQNPRLCPHLHLPLQSGCDATLKRMIRRTTQREFRAVMDEARTHIPNAAIATDMIVGYPGESDAEFEISAAFAEAMNFAGMHIFRYSPRPGTAAIRLPDQVSDEVKKERSERLHEIARRAESAFAQAHVGRKVPILWEAVSGATEGGYLNNGYTDTFLRVRLIAPEVFTNRITPVRLREYDPQDRLLYGVVE